MSRTNMKMTPGELRYFRAYIAYLAGQRAWAPQGADYGVDRFRAARVREWTEELAGDLRSHSSRARRAGR